MVAIVNNQLSSGTIRSFFIIDSFLKLRKSPTLSWHLISLSLSSTPCWPSARQAHHTNRLKPVGTARNRQELPGKEDYPELDRISESGKKDEGHVYGKDLQQAERSDLFISTPPCIVIHQLWNLTGLQIEREGERFVLAKKLDLELRRVSINPLWRMDVQ